MTAILLREAADSIESHNLYGNDDEQFLRCNICDMPADDERGPQHGPGCLVARLRTAADQMESMVLVPVEPTEAMCDAGYTAINNETPGEDYPHYEAASEAWRSMISASQSREG